MTLVKAGEGTPFEYGTVTILRKGDSVMTTVRDKAGNVVASYIQSLPEAIGDNATREYWIKEIKEYEEKA